MSIIQNNSDLRFIRRQNLEQESLVVGNYFKDIINSFGIDCHYYKLSLLYPEIFSTIIDQNNILYNAYGYQYATDYHISATMITYMEVENDIFNLNKYGLIPDTNVNFYFDSKEFACALAYQLGKLKEYKIDEVEVSYDLTPEEVQNFDFAEYIRTDFLSAEIVADLNDIEVKLGEETEVRCFIRKCTDLKINIPVNNFLYKSFNYSIYAEHPEDAMILFKFVLKKIPRKNKYHLSGKIYGSVLFHDLEMIGKYSESIVPCVGDVIVIDFPSTTSPERYEITECTNKQLTSDGINPLLHEYIWKCKAKRFVDSENNLPEENMDDKKVAEKIDLTSVGMEKVADKISIYTDKEDMVYGGYTRRSKLKDATMYDGHKQKPFELIQYENIIDIIEFGNGTKLCTDGFDLYFVVDNKSIILNMKRTTKSQESIYVSKDLQFLKATGSGLYFTNVNNVLYILIEDAEEITEETEAYVYLSRFDKLTEFTNANQNPNTNGENFYKFSNCNTILYSSEKHLYCKFESGKIVQLV